MENLIKERTRLNKALDLSNDEEETRLLSIELSIVLNNIKRKQSRIDHSAELLASAYLSYHGGNESSKKIAMVAYQCADALEEERQKRIDKYKL